MAIITFLLSLIARKANDIVQAVFGWSVIALFGRLPRRKQVLVTSALVLSLAWPLFVIGTFAPEVASWAIALVPFHHWLGDTGIRVVWIVLAVISPLLVGLLVYIALPHTNSGVAAWMVRGYPVALGFFIAFVVVVVTVPVLKLISVVRRWSDDHVYVQPHDGAYDAVLACLVEACRRAGDHPEVSDAPAAMVIATTVMRYLAKGEVATLVPGRLRRVTCDGVQLYQYPGDLLLRGRSDHVAKIRAMLARTKLDEHAYLVQSDAAQQLQDRLSDLGHRMDRGASAQLAGELADVYRDASHADIPYADWTILDGLARKLERRLIGAEERVPELPLDHVGDVPASATA